MTKRKDAVKSDIAKFREDLERTGAPDDVIDALVDIFAVVRDLRSGGYAVAREVALKVAGIVASNE